MNSPTILITNDDGIYSAGIFALWRAMKEIGNPIVVAPDKERSSVSHAITITSPLRLKKINRAEGFEGYAVSGTPADCVKLSIKSLYKKKPPDIIISGINRGGNMGENIIYSGTVSAAAEGANFGIPSIAISLASDKTDYFDLSKTSAKKIVRHVIKNGMPKGTLLNVNIPYCKQKEISGFKFTRQGNQYFKDKYIERVDPQNQKYYWIKGEVYDEDESIEQDGKAVSKNYISISPIHFKVTNETYLAELKNKFIDEQFK